MQDKKSILQEFREFIQRGNVLDLAVGVIIAGAFQGIVNSLVKDVIMPVVTLLTGGIDFSNWFLSLNGHHYDTLQQAEKAGAATLNYGTFLTAIINFLMMAAVIFAIVKFLSVLDEKTKWRKKENEEAAPATTKICPYCKSEIAIDASRCPHCTSVLEEEHGA